MPEPGLSLTINVDERELARYLARLDMIQGLPLEQRTGKGMDAVGRLLVPLLRSAAPIGPGLLRGGTLYRGGNLRRKIKAKRIRKRFGEVASVWAGSTAPHQGLVVGGTRPHSLEAKRMGKSLFAAFNDGNVRRLDGMHHPGSRPDPYVDRVIDAHRAEIEATVARDVFGNI
jgi:hypothetical protein